jgi:hypothetical protein
MAKEFHDGVAQAVTVTGTGNATLATTTTYPARRTLQSVVSAGAVVPYLIAAVDSNGTQTGEWETGEGTYLGSNAFERTRPQAGSSAVPVSFSAGTKKFSLTVNAADLRPLAALTAGMALTYNGDGTVATLTANGVTSTLAYTTINGKKRLSTITGGGSTTTVTYNSDGTVASIA